MKNNWERKKIGEVCKLSQGLAINVKTKHYLVEKSDLPLLRIKDLKNNTVEQYVDPNNYPKNCLVTEKDLIYTRTGQIGLVFTGRFGILHNNSFKIEPDKSLLREYLFLFLQSESFKNQILKLASRTAQPDITHKIFKEQIIFVPPISEQKRIVAILDEAFEGIDRAIANTKKNLANSRELFESYLNAIFTHKGDGWVEKTLGDVCQKVEYGSSAKSLVKGEIPVLRMGNIQNGAIDWSNLVYTIDKEEINKYFLKYNDVLFNRTNSDEHVGKTAIYKGEMPAIFAGYLIRIHRKEELIDADFLNFYLNSYTAREYGKSIMSRSVNQANINGTKLKGYPISLPSLSIQKQIVENLSFLRAETQRLEAIYRQKIAALNELKQSILQKAFTGELTADTPKTAKEGIAA